MQGREQRTNWDWDDAPVNVRRALRKWQVCNNPRFKNFAKSKLAIKDGKQHFHPVKLKSLAPPPTFKTDEQQKEQIMFDNVKVYPNPFTDKLFIELDSETSANFILYDLTGKVLLKKTIKGYTATTVELPNIAAGIYFYECRNETDEVIITDKIIKQ